MGLSDSSRDRRASALALCPSLRLRTAPREVSHVPHLALDDVPSLIPRKSAKAHALSLALSCWLRRYPSGSPSSTQISGLHLGSHVFGPPSRRTFASTGASRLCIGTPTSRVSAFHEVDTSFHGLRCNFVAHRANNLPFSCERCGERVEPRAGPGRMTGARREHARGLV